MLNTIGWVTFYWHWKHITLYLPNLFLGTSKKLPVSCKGTLWNFVSDFFFFFFYVFIFSYRYKQSKRAYETVNTSLDHG